VNEILLSDNSLKSVLNLLVEKHTPLNTYFSGKDLSENFLCSSIDINEILNDNILSKHEKQLLEFYNKDKILNKHNTLYIILQHKVADRKDHFVIGFDFTEKFYVIFDLVKQFSSYSLYEMELWFTDLEEKLYIDNLNHKVKLLNEGIEKENMKCSLDINDYIMIEYKEKVLDSIYNQIRKIYGKFDINKYKEFIDWLVIDNGHK
jgi:hypothetical protein